MYKFVGKQILELANSGKENFSKTDRMAVAVFKVLLGLKTENFDENADMLAINQYINDKLFDSKDLTE